MNVGGREAPLQIVGQKHESFVETTYGRRDELNTAADSCLNGGTVH